MLSFSEFLRKYRVKYSEKKQKIGKNYKKKKKKVSNARFWAEKKIFLVILRPN